jgi:dynein heavy chain
MNQPGGGKNDIPNRLKRQFAIFNVPLPTISAINGIFGRLVEGRFSSDVFSPEVVSTAAKLVPMTVMLWNKIQQKMLPTPAKFHYLFNMRELSKVGKPAALVQLPCCCCCQDACTVCDIQQRWLACRYPHEGCS